MTGCEWCDQIGPDETRRLAEYHEAHRAFHDFGRVIWAEMVEPWAIPLVGWLDRALTR